MTSPIVVQNTDTGQEFVIDLDATCTAIARSGLRCRQPVIFTSERQRMLALVGSVRGNLAQRLLELRCFWHVSRGTGPTSFTREVDRV